MLQLARERAVGTDDLRARGVPDVRTPRLQAADRAPPVDEKDRFTN